MFRFINSQVFKPTRIQFHRPRTGVDQVWRSISTTPKRSARGRGRAQTPGRSSADRTGTQSRKTTHQDTDDKQGCSGGSGNNGSGPNGNPPQPKPEEENEGETSKADAEDIKSRLHRLETRIGELSQAITKCDRKVDTKCRNITKKMETDREVARDLTVRLRDFLVCLLSSHRSGPPAGGATKRKSPPTTVSSSSTTGDSKH
ncbi:unnamed protein product [Tuber melanosporum]|uniref:(Perigord truffle) hypothetical protein n=1 Tax=Tuber melanosporum (strain Mel28) TaxID=656061 RepID=D5GMH2_TUBMM|nr:uncharacterized protein GSTUM_00010714001 [Tuber melanosporum]CAZ85715.1 unnamed protein product [Tuber melanosporum]